MTTITTEAATLDRWDDAVAALTGGGDGKTCWCMWWHLPNAEWKAVSVDERQERLRTQMATEPPRALIAYVDGAPAGWCRVAPRVEQRRLMRAVITASSDIPLDDETAWAVSCLVVRREFRGQGVAHEMLAAAIEFARSAGATSVEAYPIDTSQGRRPTTALFHGTEQMFARAGFVETARPKPDRPIMRLTLA